MDGAPIDPSLSRLNLYITDFKIKTLQKETRHQAHGTHFHNLKMKLTIPSGTPMFKAQATKFCKYYLGIQGRSDKYLASLPSGNEANHAKSKSASMLYTVTLLLRWRPSKIGLTSFNVVASRFLMCHARVPRNRLPRKIT